MATSEHRSLANYIEYVLIQRLEKIEKEKGTIITDQTDEIFDKIGILATKEHRSMTNYIEYVLMQHLEQIEKEHGEIAIGQTE